MMWPMLLMLTMIFSNIMNVWWYSRRWTEESKRDNVDRWRWEAFGVLLSVFSERPNRTDGIELSAHKKQTRSLQFKKYCGDDGFIKSSWMNKEYLKKKIGMCFSRSRTEFNGMMLLVGFQQFYLLLKAVLQILTELTAIVASIAHWAHEFCSNIWWEYERASS